MTFAALLPARTLGQMVAVVVIGVIILNLTTKRCDPNPVMQVIIVRKAETTVL